MFSLSLLAILLIPYALAAPTPQLAPIHRVERRAASGGYIVKFKPSAVPKDNRRTWIDNQLSRANIAALSYDQEESLKTGWSETVFDGFSGVLSEDAIEQFRASGDVEYIVEGQPGVRRACDDADKYSLISRWRDLDNRFDFPVSRLIMRRTSQTLTARSRNNAPWVLDVHPDLQYPLLISLQGLQRISQLAPLSRTDDSATNFLYTFDNTAGSGGTPYALSLFTLAQACYSGYLRRGYGTLIPSMALGGDINNSIKNRLRRLTHA